jgi:alanyl-tRNA synthetase
MTTVSAIRTRFIEFFARHGHTPIPSSPLVPQNDPTLMFTNAGMVQFKNVFTGQEARPYQRAVTSQKCVRAGGKHNDLDNVGYTARHHTFFEMLGNFSFGDYFKEQAIALAWELITKEYGLSKDRLLVTVYHDDDTAFDLWRRVAGLPESRIIRIATNDNFWAMGDTGPCGPCSEIFFDHGDHIPGGPPGSADQDGDRFIEIWNLVFMQFEQLPGHRIPLPKPSIDTGMGLERLAAVLQGKHDNYDIDLFVGLMRDIAHQSGTEYVGSQNNSHKVIADHLRSCCFLIADGVLPSNEGRGYVLRRIMRRAMRHAHMLGCAEPLMHRLVNSLIVQMGAAYPELSRAQALITETLRTEEERFRVTLDRGLKLLNDETSRLASGSALPGEVAFRLYDTFGFPLDLTQDILRGEGKSVDTDGFETCMEEQRARARASWSGSGEKATEQLWFAQRMQYGATEFLGYDRLETDATLVSLVVDGDAVDEVEAGVDVMILTNQTPFYGESGGQMGDIGVLTTANGAVVRITDTQKPLSDLIVHIGHVESGTIARGDTAHLAVDKPTRDALRANHSATHLLHKVLRTQLGSHISQKGSMVAADRLRFDISHPRAITREEIEAIEREVNRLIRQNSEVRTVLSTPDQAIEAGAMALFGEKYGDEVRVVTMGEADDAMRSVELCGGTHVQRTGDIGMFKLIQESALAAGVRRIEGLTGEEAFAYCQQQESDIKLLAQTLKCAVAELPERLEALLRDRKTQEEALKDARRKLAMGGGGGAAETPLETVGGISLLARTLENVSPKDLKPLADGWRGQCPDGVVLLLSRYEGKASVLVAVNGTAREQVDAVTLARAASEALGGKGGGGRPDLAQAGGGDDVPLDAALQAVRALLADRAAA